MNNPVVWFIQIKESRCREHGLSLTVYDTSLDKLISSVFSLDMGVTIRVTRNELVLTPILIITK